MYLIESISTKQFLKNLISIISQYDVYYYTDSSKKSSSEYLTVKINKNEYVFRIADHELPTVSYGHATEKYATEYYDFRLKEYEKAKETLMLIIKKNRLNKISSAQDWIKIRKELYSDYMLLLKNKRTNEIVDSFVVMDILGSSSNTEIKKYQNFTIHQLFDRASISMPNEIRKLLDKYGVE